MLIKDSDASRYFLTLGIEINIADLWVSHYSEHQQYLYDTILKFRDQSWSYIKISQWFNDNNILTTRGKKFIPPSLFSIVKKKKISNDRFNRTFQAKINEAYIIVIRFGENISETERAANPQLQVAVKAFVDYLADGRPVKVILTTPFWTNLGVNQNFLALSEKNKWPLIPLHDLGLANENMALERFENISVGRHPGDLGMERIATRIWTVLANEL
ncbi:MAG: hypothetical protein O3A40_06885 [Bacteroidetes bacterium]|nr:hypothetical protein [Bacteroidota bacterium]